METVRQYTNVQLAAATAMAGSYREVVRSLGLVDSPAMTTRVSRRIKALQIDTSHFTRGRRYTPEVLADAVANASSVAGVLRHLGLNEAGGTHAHVSRTIKRLGLDTSHFRRDQGARVKPTRLAPDRLLIMAPGAVKRTKPHQLRRALVESGRPYVCERCGCDGRWQGELLTLHVDHISGDFRDNRAENLRFLCPNCHALTPNFAGRSKGSIGGRPATAEQPCAVVSAA